MSVCECMFACTYWEALCDGDLDIEEKDSGSESSADSNRLLGITEHTAHAGRKQLPQTSPVVQLVKMLREKQNIHARIE